MSVNDNLVLALVKDLFFGVRLSDAVTSLGCTFKRVPSRAKLLEELDRQSPSLLIVDLSVGPGNLSELAKRAGGARLVAFGPHVDFESRTAAKNAGFHEVVANSRLVRELPQLLARNLEGHRDLAAEVSESTES